MDDGRAYQEHLEQVAPHSVSAQVELESLLSVPLPESAVYVWHLFLELSAHRSSSGFGPSPLSWQDLDAWQRISGDGLSSLEREWVFELDRIFLKDVATEMKKRAKKK